MRDRSNPGPSESGSFHFRPGWQAGQSRAPPLISLIYFELIATCTIAWPVPFHFYFQVLTRRQHPTWQLTTKLNQVPFTFKFASAASKRQLHLVPLDHYLRIHEPPLIIVVTRRYDSNRTPNTKAWLQEFCISIGYALVLESKIHSTDKIE